MVKPEELAAFMAVAESGSFAAAARRLGVAAPAVSKSIKSLESRLNVPLFRRNTRKVVITDDGIWLMGQAQSVLDNLDGIEGHFLRGDDALSGQLRVGAATPFALHYLVPVIAGFRERYPRARIALHTDEDNTDLIGENLDVVVRVGELEDSSLKVRRLGSLHRGVFAAPAYLEQYGTPACPEDITAHACLGFAGPARLNHWPLRQANGVGVRIEPVFSSNNGEVLKQAALQGYGLICVSTFVVQKELEERRLLPVLPDYLADHEVPVSALHYASTRTNVLLRKFLEFTAGTLAPG